MSTDQETDLHGSLPEGNAGPEIDAVAPPPAPGAIDGQPPAGAPPALPDFEIPKKWPKYAQETVQKLLALPEGGRDHAENWLKHWKEQQGYTTKVEQERAALRDQFSPINQLLEPYAMQWQMQGLDRQAGLRQVLAWTDYVARDPSGAIKKLAELYGVSLQGMVAEAPYVAPEVQELRDWKRQQETQSHQQRLFFQQQQQHQVLEQLRAFESATDESGNAKYPHYQRVQDRMTQAFRGGFAQSLDDAYQFAIHNDPELQAEIAAENARKAAATRAAEAKKAIEASRTVKAKGTAERAPKAGSFADDLRKQLEASGMT